MYDDPGFVEFLPRFASSMPEAYRQRYDAGSVAEHAHVAYSRGQCPLALARLWTGRAIAGVLPVCVVAADRPGLLSSLSAALLLAELDVVRAEAYTRRSSADTAEAVDLFWLRRSGETERSGAPGSAELARLRAIAIALLDGVFDAAELAARCRADAAPRRDVEVRMLFDARGHLSAIEVRDDDRPGVLLRITQALHALRLQISRCEARSLDGVVIDRFYVEELDGAPVAPRRAAEVEHGLLAELDPPLIASPIRASGVAR